MTRSGIRVLIADDHAVVREGIRSVLDDVPDLEVVAEATDGVETLDLVRTYRPDVVVLDITMPRRSGLEVAAELRATAPETAVLILSMHDETEYVLEAVRAGARGYLLKDAAPAELRDAIRTVGAGEAWLPPHVARQLSDALRAEREANERRRALERLTAREREVLMQIADGRTNREIAGELGISRRTVESHREHLMQKLGIRTVAGLTRFVIECGLRSGAETP